MSCPYTVNCKKFLTKSCDSEETCIRKIKLDFLYNNSLLSEFQRKKLKLRVDADGSDKEEFIQLSNIENNIIDFVKKGKNIYIYSHQCGNGKSSWGIRLLQSYIEKIWYSAELKPKALYINVPRFLLALKDSITSPSEYVNFIKENIIEADLVLWDELGSKVGTQFEIDNLFNMINNRLDAGKSNIYTSNISPSELSTLIGERLYSRIINLSDLVAFKGKDKRGILN